MINAGLGLDMIHTNQLKYSESVFRNFLCKLLNKWLSHIFIPHEMLKREIRPILKSGKGCKTDSTNGSRIQAPGKKPKSPRKKSLRTIGPPVKKPPRTKAPPETFLFS